MTVSLDPVLFSLAAGALPTLLWLWFWLTEDQEKPEPRLIIALVFVIGAISVLVAIPFQEMAAYVFESTTSLAYLASSAAIEEVLKFGLVGLFLLLTPFADEPIDYAIYFITGALGFAALENVLYVSNPMHQIILHDAVALSSLRFLGSTLLHSITGAILGLLLGSCWNKSRWTKAIVFMFGLFLVTLLHSMYNHFIISGNTRTVFIVLACLWVLAIGILFSFERVKAIRSR